MVIITFVSSDVLKSQWRLNSCVIEFVEKYTTFTGF